MKLNVHIKNEGYKIRKALKKDYEFLKSMLYEAIYTEPNESKPDKKF